MLDDDTMVADNHEDIRTLLTDTLSLIIRSGIKFKHELNIEGLIGVHIDKQDAIFVHISNTFDGSGRENLESSPTHSHTGTLDERIAGKENAYHIDTPERLINKRSSITKESFGSAYHNKVLQNISGKVIEGGLKKKKSISKEVREHKVNLTHVKQEPPDTYDNVTSKQLLQTNDSDSSDDTASPQLTENRLIQNIVKSETVSDFHNEWDGMGFVESVDGEEDSEQTNTVQNDYKPYIIQPGGIDWSNEILDDDDDSNSFPNDEIHRDWSQSLMHTEDKVYGLLSLGDHHKHATTSLSKTIRKFPKRHTFKKRHEFERPYVCKVCGKANRRPSDLVKHMRVHTGERPFNCPVCSIAFKSTSPLYCHLRRRHGWKMGQKLVFEGKRVKSSIIGQVYGPTDTVQEVFTIT